MPALYQVRLPECYNYINSETAERTVMPGTPYLTKQKNQLRGEKP